jgi:hypothetical protein
MAGVGDHELHAIDETFFAALLTAAFDVALGSVNADHGGDVPKT